MLRSDSLPKRLVSRAPLTGPMIVVLTVAMACSIRGDLPVVPDESIPVSSPMPTVILEDEHVALETSLGSDSAATQADVGICGTGTIVIKAEDFIGVDPARYDFGSSFPYELVYSRLFKINAQTGDVEPDLALSYTVSEDGRIYSIRLREDVAYSDGSLLAPSDIHFSFARSLKERPATTAKYVLGGIVGAQDVMNGSATELAGVTIVDDSTIQIRLDAPDWDFAAKTAHPVASIVSEKNVGLWESEWTRRGKHDISTSYLAELPAGTGPLSVADLRDLGNHADFTPNSFYWSDAPGVRVVQRDPNYGDGQGQRPAYDAFDIFEVGHEVADSFNAGDPTTFDGEPLQGYDLVISERIPEVAFFAFNTAIEPFDDVQFRRALAAAADNRGLGYLAESPALRDVATGLLSPNMPGFVERPAPLPDESAASAYADASRYLESTQPVGVSFHVTDPISPYDIDIITRYWQRWLGLDVEVRGMRTTDFGYTISPDHTAGYEARLAHGTLPMRFVEVQPTRNSPEEVLGLFRNLFGANAVSPEVEELNMMLDAAAAESDAIKRIELYSEIEAHIMDRVLAIPIAWGSPTKWEVVREWIDGYEPSPYVPLSLDGVTVDTTHPDYPADRPCE